MNIFLNMDLFGGVGGMHDPQLQHVEPLLLQSRHVPSSSLTGDRTWPQSLGAQGLSNGTGREVPQTGCCEQWMQIGCFSNGFVVTLNRETTRQTTVWEN